MSTLPLILVINCGSSSLKFSVLEANQDWPILSGIAEKLGLSDAFISFKDNKGNKTIHDLDISSHEAALTVIIEQLNLRGLTKNITVVGHRVAHGGSKFKHSVLITPDILNDIKELALLAPLHNPANAKGIEVTTAAFNDLPQVAVFDTSFHQTLAPAVYTYAIPYEYQEKLQVRKYGFHGTSHRYIAETAVKQFNLDPCDHGLIIAHLGNGSSVCAVQDGKSVDTSMGMTPLEGLVMGTRSGDIDFGALVYIAHQTGKTLEELDILVNKESGLLGISGISSDCRTLQEERDKGDERARLAIDVFVHRLARHIGAHLMSLKRLDAIIFTGGIGENSALIRALVSEHLKPLNVIIDSNKNNQTVGGKTGIISSHKNPIIAVIPTNEEKMIANDAISIVKSY